MYLGVGGWFERRRESFLPALPSCQCYRWKQIDSNLSWSVLLLTIEMTSNCSKLCSFWRYRDRFVNYPLERFQSVFFTQPSLTIKRGYERERTRTKWLERDCGVFRTPLSYFDPVLFFFTFQAYALLQNRDKVNFKPKNSFDRPRHFKSREPSLPLGIRIW